jgi:hypothetical protein
LLLFHGQLAITESSVALEILEQLDPETFAEVDDEMLNQLIWDAAELKKQQIAKPELILERYTPNLDILVFG